MDNKVRFAQFRLTDVEALALSNLAVKKDKDVSKMLREILHNSKQYEAELKIVRNLMEGARNESVSD